MAGRANGKHQVWKAKGRAMDIRVSQNTRKKIKSASIVMANLQKVSFVHVDTKCEVLPNLNNIHWSRIFFINQPLWLKSSKCKSDYIFSILFNRHSGSN